MQVRIHAQAPNDSIAEEVSAQAAFHTPPE